MEFKLKRQSFIGNDLQPEGAIVDIDVKDLAKTKDGKIDYKKHSALCPLDEKFEPEPENPAIQTALGGAAAVNTLDPATGTTPAAPVTPPAVDPAAAEHGFAPEQVEAVQAALEAIDPLDDNGWVKDSLKPKLEPLIALVGFEITRKQLDVIAPNFTRPVPE